MGMMKEPTRRTTKMPRYLFLPFLVAALLLNVDRVEAVVDLDLVGAVEALALDLLLRRDDDGRRQVELRGVDRGRGELARNEDVEQRPGRRARRGARRARGQRRLRQERVRAERAERHEELGHHHAHRVA